MDLTHTFSVPTTIDETWAAFQDIASVAACFPGAQVTSVEGDSFEGSCKVKLGPIALVYNGSGHFVEKDAAAHRMVIEAKGKDKRGNGTAGAHVTAQLTDTGGSTEVTVVTDLAITGKPAQFGRGVMQDVSDKLLGLFVECLKDKVGDGAPAEAAPAPAEVETPKVEAPNVEAPKHAAPKQEVEALDLGATVLPVLAKAYWKPVLAVVVIIAVVLVLVL